MEHRSEPSSPGASRRGHPGCGKPLPGRPRRLAAESLLLLAALVLGTWACEEKPPPKTKEQVMQEKLEERLALWKADMTGTCLERALEKAVLIVDSTLIANARQHRDLSGKPAIPPRPDKPDFVAPADSLPVKPLLQRGN